MEQSIPACFLRTVFTSKRAWRQAGGEGEMEGGEEECMSVCVKKGGGRVTLNSWVDVNKAVTVWMVILSCYLCSRLSLSIQPPSSVATSGQHLLSSFTFPRPPSLCNPPSARKFGCNQTFNRQDTPAGLGVKSMDTHKHIQTHKKHTRCRSN